MGYKYTSIDEEPREERRGRGWPWKRELIAAVLIAALSSIATFGIMSFMNSVKAHKPQSPQQFSCGDTFEEAHQRGCTFDVLTASWLHPKCSQYGQQEFLELSKTSNNGTAWRYWEEKGGLHELGGYEALSYLPDGFTYWTTQEEHVYHCVWMLWRVYDAAITGKRLDSKTSSYEHTKHCLDALAFQARIGAGEELLDIIVSGELHDVGWNVC